MTGSSTKPNPEDTLVQPRQGEVFSYLYLASQQLARADQSEDILEILSRALQGAHDPAVLLSVQKSADSDEEVFTLYTTHEDAPAKAGSIVRLPTLFPALKVSEIEPGFRNNEQQVSSDIFQQSFIDCLVVGAGDDEEIDGTLGILIRQLGLVSAILIPVSHQRRLKALLLIGSTASQLMKEQAKPYIGLADLAESAYERIYTRQVLEKRLTTLQSLNVISQVVALQADLNELYRIIHNEVRQLLGELTFFIAIYDSESNMVEIQYLFEMGTEEAVKPPPFELGMGLTSLVIKNRQPIMMVEDTERRLKELGAQQVGLAAKSWLGVPMLVAGEATGAIVIQDLIHEHRFDEDDLQLMVTVASQVAITIRYITLLNRARQQAERDRALYEITAQIRASSDAQKILHTAAREAARLVGARRTHLVLSPTGEGSVEEQP